MFNIELTKEEIKYLNEVLNFFLKNQANAIQASGDVLYMVNKINSGTEVKEKTVTNVEKNKEKDSKTSNTNKK